MLQFVFKIQQNQTTYCDTTQHELCYCSAKGKGGKVSPGLSCWGGCCNQTQTASGNFCRELKYREAWPPKARKCHWNNTVQLPALWSQRNFNNNPRNVRFPFLCWKWIQTKEGCEPFLPPKILAEMEKLSDQNSEHRSSCYKYKIRLMSYCRFLFSISVALQSMTSSCNPTAWLPAIHQHNPAITFTYRNSIRKPLSPNLCCFIYMASCTRTPQKLPDLRLKKKKSQWMGQESISNLLPFSAFY